MAEFAYAHDVGIDSIAAIQQLARSSKVPFSVTSTFRPGDPGYHGKRNAVDMIGTVANMRKLAAYLYQYSPYLLELIHSNGAFFVKNGARGFHYSPDVVSQHYSHVHCAATMSGLRAASTGKDVISASAPGPSGGGCVQATLFGLATLATTVSGFLYFVH